jgi:DNA-binding beta-propeller fold protein YncE
MDGPSGVHYCAQCKRLFVADAINNRIIRCKPDGSEWEILESPGFDRAYDVHHDHDSGYLYVAESYRITRVNWAGTDITRLGFLFAGNGVGQFDIVYALDFDPATGYIYCADWGNSRIIRTKIDGSGWVQICKEDGGGNPIPGAGNCEFMSPSGVFYDVDSGYIYASDSGGNNRISRFTIGKAGWQELSGAGGDSFQGPWGIFYHSGTSFVVVADWGNNRLVKTKMDGTGWQAFGGPGAGQYQYSLPKGIYYERG